MKHRKHTLSATAAIAAALALSAAPLAAQDTGAPGAAPTMQAQPVEPPAPVVASPAATVDVPDVTAAPTATPDEPAPTSSEPAAPAATGAGEAVAPVTRSTTRTTSSRTTTVSRTVVPAAASMAAVPVAATPASPPAADLAPLPVDTQTTSIVTPTDAAPQPTPTQTNNVVGTMGLILLALLALAILAAGLLFLRRRHPVAAVVEEDRTLNRPVDERPVAEAPVTTPVAEAATVAPMAAPATFRRRDPNPVAGALPSDGASVDLPAKLPESYDERARLLDRMINAKPDKANPFTDRRARMRRARLIMQSLGQKFDREPWIDFSQYPNNWPELQRPYYKAA